MNNISEIRKKVKKSIDHVDDITVKMVYALLEVHEKEMINEEEDFNNEMQKRIEDYKANNIKTYTHEELVKYVRAAHKKRLELLK